MSIVSPYSAPPASGDLIGQIMNFIGQSRAMALDAGTRNQLNGQLGYDANVDPFAMQKYAGEGQRQQLAGDANQRAQETQGWIGQDRQSQAAMLQRYANNPQFANDPMLGPAVQYGGANAQIGEMIGRLMGSDRAATSQGKVNEQSAATDFQNRTALQQQQNDFVLAQIQKEIDAGKYDRDGTGGANSRDELARRKQEALDVFQRTGDTSAFYKLMAEGNEMNPQALEMIKTDKQKAEQAQLEAEKEAKRKRLAQGGDMGYTAEQQQQLNQTIAPMQGKDPVSFVLDAIAKSQTFGASKSYNDAVKGQHPELYDQIWNMLQLEMKQSEYNKKLQQIKNSQEENARAPYSGGY